MRKGAVSIIVRLPLIVVYGQLYFFPSRIMFQERLLA